MFLCFILETVKSGIVAAEYGEDDSDPEEDINDKFTDLSIMACLLCKRQFPNKEALERHQKFSDLHKVTVRARWQSDCVLLFPGFLADRVYGKVPGQNFHTKRSKSFLVV